MSLSAAASPAARLRRQTLAFVSLCALSFLLFRGPLAALISLSWRDERYTHTVLMPWLCAGLIYLERRRVFGSARFWPKAGFPLTALGMVLSLLAAWRLSALQPDAELTVVVSSIAAVWICSFLLCYGPNAFRAALYPLALLLLAVPLPAPVVETAQTALQHATAEVTGALFKLTNLPVFREGLRFSLPGVTVEVARACSGIRSTIALLIAALVLSHLFLRSGWRQAIVVLAAIPISIFKNAVRIVTLSWLGVSVSMDYLFGDLHHRGGPVFLLLSFALLVPLLLALQKWEGRPGRKAGARPVSASIRS